MTTSEQCSIAARRTADSGGLVAAEPTRGPIARWLAGTFGLDLRSLALFRVAIALVLLGDLANRARSLAAHYSDEGVLPRADALALAPSPWHWSLHLASGTVEFQAALFVVAAVAALMLLVGWRTRLATVVSWLLLASLHGRNHLVLQGGDVLLRCLLFWAMFLPLGACWSLDRARRSDDAALPRRVATAGSAAFVLQLALLYACSGLLKNHAIWTTDGTAGFYALSIDQLATPFGHWMLGFPRLLKVSTLAILWFERLGPLLLLVPWAPARLVTVALFALAHLAMFATLELGPFPFVAWAAWCALLPTRMWQRLAARARERGARVRVWYDADCGFCLAMARLVGVVALPGARIGPAQADPAAFAEMTARNAWLVDTPDGVRHHGYGAVVAVLACSPFFRVLAWPARLVAPLGRRAYAWVAAHRARASAAVAPLMRARPLAVYGGSRGEQALCAYLLVLVVLWNWRTVAWAFPAPSGAPPLAERLLPKECNWLLEVPRLDQWWNMFAPFPLIEDGWYAIPARLKDGSQVDLADGGPVRDGPAKPDQVAARYDGERWRKYLMNLSAKEHGDARGPFARWLAADWNARHPDRPIESFDIVFWVEPTVLDGEPTLRRESLWHYEAPK